MIDEEYQLPLISVLIGLALIVSVLAILAVAFLTTTLTILEAGTVVLLAVVLGAVACYFFRLPQLVLVPSSKRASEPIRLLVVLAPSAAASRRITANAIQEALAVGFGTVIFWASASDFFS